MNSKKIYRLDYTEPNYFVNQLYLTIQLDEENTYISSQFQLIKNPRTKECSFLLNGSQSLSFHSLKINGVIIQKEHLNFYDEGILLENLPNQALIELENEIHPNKNSRLQGIFITDDFFCSDCEPQGFRHITYFPDRPDIMTTYRVKIIADQKYNVLLSNGNLIESGVLGETLHYALWHDPFPKPTYLFALVAGELSFIEDTHIRPDHTNVQLRIYAKAPHIKHCAFALASLKRAMKWDEERFNLICDLDFYNIVAVNDFNGGAMENKGLNIFNAKYILADEKIATDDDFLAVEAVIGHEYFHNWTGNRITCRDWFNLSLKEGLTVFREQEFTADLHHRGIKRIEDVKLLRAHQFPEDAGPLAHPVRPDECEKVENFYTTTIYEKGAEIIRLYQTILGFEGFNQGIQHYIAHYDGQAITTDQFLDSMEQANHRTLTHFDRWYSQAGTPQVYASTTFDNANQRYTLSLRQDVANQKPQPIPINYALWSAKGQLLQESLFMLRDAQQSLIIEGISEVPIISLLRNFSAPIILHYPYTLDELIVILHHETDAFSRWEALQRISELIILSNENNEKKGEQFAQIYAPLFPNVHEEPELYARLFMLPSLNLLLAKQAIAEANSLLQTKTLIEKYLAITFKAQWYDLYQTFQQDQSRSRALKNGALYYLSYLEEGSELLLNHYTNATNMTDRQAALKLAIERNAPIKQALLEHFLHEYQDNATVVDKWFSLQVQAPTISLAELNHLIEHPFFTLKNPNRARSVIGVLGQNSIALHSNVATYYAWLAEKIADIDELNPQTAARMIAPFTRIQNYSPEDKSLIIAILKTLATQHHLSTNVQEHITRILS